MPRKIVVQEDTWRLEPQARSCIEPEVREDGTVECYHGHVVTPVGIVVVSSWLEETEWRGASSYRFVFGGALHMRWEARSRTMRGLAIMAHRWAKRIAAEHGRGP